MRNRDIVTILFTSCFLNTAISAPGDLSVSSLPASPEYDNIVCFEDSSGTLGKCSQTIQGAPGQTIPPVYLAPVLVDGNGTLLGTALDSSTFISRRGYTLQLRNTDGLVLTRPISFTSTDCTGKAYLVTYTKYSDSGYTFRSDHNLTDALYYVPKGRPAENLTLCSSWAYSTTTCEIAACDEVYMIAIEENDPAITGIQNNIGIPGNPYPLPLTLDVYSP